MLVLVVFIKNMTNRINRVKHEDFTKIDESTKFHISVVVACIRMYKIHEF